MWRIGRPFLVVSAAGWIWWLRWRHRPRGQALSEADRQALIGYFDADLLDKVRVRSVQSIAPPWSVRLLRLFGMQVEFDFTRAAGIALGDVILITQPVPRGARRRSLLCHELVHVVQYDVLGIAAFARRYIDGWLDAGRVYTAIPLEQQAFAFESLFDTSTSRFPIEAEVRRQLVS